MKWENRPESYEAAMAELEQIKVDLEAGNLPVDLLLDAVKRVEFLVAFCKQKLRDTESALKNLGSK
jgi:exodeoxyribonuclease VII small subunit